MNNGAAIDALMGGPRARGVNPSTDTIPGARPRRETAPIVRNGGVEGSYLRASASKATLRRVRRLGAPRGTRTAEGFLFPSTYELRVGAKAKALVTKQLDAFRAR